MRTLLTAIAALTLGGCLVPKDQFDKLAQERARDQEAATASAAALEKKAAELDAQLAAAKQEREALQQRVTELETNVADEQLEKRTLNEQLAQLTALNEELAKNTKQLEAAKAELEKRSGEYQSLAQSLKGEIQAGKIELSELKGRMTVKMKDKILFSSGSAKLGKEGMAALDKVAEALKDVQGRIIRVEGHTDSDPLPSDSPFPSNWELSVARAMAVVAHLQEKGVDPTKLSVAGYGQYQPIAPNKTAEQKSKNRRIEIVLAPENVPVVPGVKSKTAAK